MSDLGGHKPTLKGHSKGFGSKKFVYEPSLFTNPPNEPLLFKPLPPSGRFMIFITGSEGLN